MGMYRKTNRILHSSLNSICRMLDVCVKFGREMGRIAEYSEPSNAPSHLQTMISNFVEHWNEKFS
jgi:hypothetical protein